MPFRTTLAHAVRNSVLVVSLSVVASCTDAPADFVAKQTGITTCDANRVSKVESKSAPDSIYQAQISLSKCKNEILESVYKASSGECQAMLPEKGRCAYFYNKNSVTISQSSKDLYVEISR